MAILVVVEEPTRSSRLRELLEESRYQVRVAAGAAEALGIAGRSTPELIVSEIALPGMDGFALCRRVKSQRKLRNVPVILLGTRPTPRDIIQGLECGADHFISKPDEEGSLSQIARIASNRGRKGRLAKGGIEVSIGGRRHFISPERRKMLDLLIAACSEAENSDGDPQASREEKAPSSQGPDGYVIGESLNQCKSEQEVSQRAMERVLDLPGVQAGWIVLEPHGSETRLAAVGNLPPSLATAADLKRDCSCHRKFLSGECYEAINMQACPLIEKVGKGRGYHLAIPLRNGDRVSGVMNLIRPDLGPFSKRELKLLDGLGNQVGAALERAQIYESLEQQVKERTIVLERQATHDSLTGLPNRNFLRDRLREMIIAGQYNGSPVALILLDLDYFEVINNTLGHQRGDLLLQQVGPRLRNFLGEADLIARLGGDDFAIALPSADRASAERVAARIMKELEPPFMIEGMPVVMDASIGISLYPDHGSNTDSLMQRAEIALHTVQQTGNGYAFFSSDYDQHSPRHLAIMGELRHALERGELFLCYQPIIELRTGCVKSLEALIRWQHPKLGLIMPDQFISLAERTGLIKFLSFWVLGEASRQCLAWRQRGLEVSISINLSARNLQDPRLPDEIAEILSKSENSPDWLDLEITERSIMSDPGRAMEILTHLTQLGVRISIDDFGTGYSSLSYLQKLPINFIKIDKSFVLDMLTNRNDAMIVNTIAGLAHHLGMQVIAEGVESREVWDKLIEFGCDSAQGFFMCRPLPLEQISKWLDGSAWTPEKASGERKIVGAT